MFQVLFNLRAHIYHCELGGVTTGQWVVGTPHKIQDTIKNFLESGLTKALKQALRHVLCFDKQVTQLGRLLVWTQLAIEKLLPQPSASGWVIQMLSVQELADAYDLPLSMRGWFQKGLPMQ
eukprot:11995145-Ditylum_brightwellii.AAC.1